MYLKIVEILSEISRLIVTTATREYNKINDITDICNNKLEKMSQSIYVKHARLSHIHGNTERTVYTPPNCDTKNYSLIILI